MTKSDDRLDEVKQLIEIMETHKIIEVKMGDIHIKREPSQDVADWSQPIQLTEAERQKISAEATKEIYESIGE